MDEGRVEPLREQRVQVGVPVFGGDVVRVPDPPERRGCAGLQVQLDPGKVVSTGRYAFCAMSPSPMQPTFTSVFPRPGPSVPG